MPPKTFVRKKKGSTSGTSPSVPIEPITETSVPPPISEEPSPQTNPPTQETIPTPLSVSTLDQEPDFLPLPPDSRSLPEAPVLESPVPDPQVAWEVIIPQCEDDEDEIPLDQLLPHLRRQQGEPSVPAQQGEPSVTPQQEAPPAFPALPAPEQEADSASEEPDLEDDPDKEGAPQDDSDSSMDIDLTFQNLDDNIKEVRVASEELDGIQFDFGEENETAYKRYNVLCSKKFIQTRTLDLQILDVLGIRDQFYQLTEKSGFEKGFWEISEPAYTSLTMEVLCTLELREHGDTGDFDVSFQMGGEAYNISDQEFAAYMCLAPGGDTTEREDSGLWDKISGLQRNKAGEKKAKQIQHPVVRFIQRAMASTICARGDSANKMNRLESVVLTHMLSAKEEIRPNLAVLMVKFWLTLANQRTKGASQISIGGYITHLAKCLMRGDFKRKKSGGTRILNVQSMVQMTHIQRDDEDGQFYWEFNDKLYPLPLPPLNLNNKNSFKLQSEDSSSAEEAESEEEEAQEVPAPTPTRSRKRRATSEVEAPSTSRVPPVSAAQPDYATILTFLQELKAAQTELMKKMEAAARSLTDLSERLEAQETHTQKILEIVEGFTVEEEQQTPAQTPETEATPSVPHQD